MRLTEIIAACKPVSVRGNADIEITALSNDSRKVGPGGLFVAVNGCGRDGREHIPSALRAGAAAVMLEACGEGEPEEIRRAAAEIPESVCVVTVASSPRAVALAADRFYGHPSGKLSLVGVTGTNGKTTVATLLYQLFRSLGHESGLLSTIANYIGDKRIETANTTSDPVTINALLASMVEAGCTHCFMEVSSIGVAQHRTDALEFRCGIFTNLTHDHLDYHGTFAEYLRCKQAFFDGLPKSSVAITNADDRNGHIMVQNTKAKVIEYSCRKLADHNCEVVEESMEGMMLRIDGQEVWTMLVGTHNAYNLLAVYCTALSLGMDRDRTLTAISALRPVKGRLENLTGPRGLSVVIDYAHTPDALENVLKTLREIERNRTLYCVFGCGGDRDRSKRPEMGSVAAKYADRIFLTSDNSRSEDTGKIIEDIRSGMDSEGLCRSYSINDRKEAIRLAIKLAPDNSTILLAGKGHEDYQIIGGNKTHFDEREIVQEIFKENS